MRFAMTARTLAKVQEDDKEINEMTAKNIMKVTRFRKDGEAELDKMVSKIKALKFEPWDETARRRRYEKVDASK